MFNVNSNKKWKEYAVDPIEAIRKIKSGNKIFIHGAAATPTPLLNALCSQENLTDIRLYHIHVSGCCRFLDPECQKKFISTSLFSGQNTRIPIQEGRADFIPIFLSDIPNLFKSQKVPLDVAIVQLSPPDKHGMCTLGTSVDTAKAAVDSAKLVIAEINERMPRTHGNSAVPFSQIDSFIYTNRALIESPPPIETLIDATIGEIISELIEDQSTLQVGIGSIPNAVIKRLVNKRDLGIHTEMFSDNIIELVEAGVITNRYKTIHNGRITTSFVNGTQKLYDFVNDNSKIEFHPCDHTNDTSMIRQNEKTIAINSAIEIDLSGQVCADSIGHQIFSGIGGQLDFMRGAALSKGGKPIIALPSTAAQGKFSRIVMTLKPGAGVVTTRGHIHWIVTEYGAVNLHGLTLRERGEALISIAHPDFRPSLKRELSEIRHFLL